MGTLVLPPLVSNRCRFVYDGQEFLLVREHEDEESGSEERTDWLIYTSEGDDVWIRLPDDEMGAWMELGYREVGHDELSAAVQRVMECHRPA